MANWQLILETLTEVAGKTNLLPSDSDLEYFVGKLSTSKLIRDVLQRHIAEYEDTFRHKTQKNQELSEKMRSLALKEMAKGNENLALEKYTNAQMLAKIKLSSSACDGLAFMQARMPSPPQLEENSDFYGASRKLQLNYSEDKGRHVVCNDSIRMGEVLFVENPEAFIVNQDFRLKFCHHCCHRVADFVTCDSCNEVLYCSLKCRDKHSPVHHFECGYLAFLQSLGVAHLALRCLFAQLPGQSERYQQMKDLQYHCDHLGSEELFQYAVTALLLTQYLESSTDYFTTNTTTRSEVCAQLVRHVLQLVVNAHAVIYTCAQPADDGAIVSTVTSPRVATGIYPSTAMMNHSCQPNIVNNFHGNTLVVRAVRDMAPGEEVFNCYGPHYMRMPRVERQAILREQYNFECECDQCSASYDITDVLSAFRCPNCTGPLVDVEGDGLCYKCGKKSPISSTMTEGLARVNAALDRAINDDCGSITELMNDWIIGRRVLFVFHETTYRLADEIARRLAQAGCWDKCLAVLTSTLVVLKKRFGDVSPVVASEFSKLSKAAEEAAKLEDPESELYEKYTEASREYKVEAEKLSLILYGCKEILDDVQL